ncbi:hypothetical protein FM038_25420 [Shewanella eurypsychrophilus]|uniref:Uncharacterized protein n=1 Tax=Shewanella eurypsychrophilus TaxID=2593656 RepID=A0ABX8S677_9GAMM|nr:MULTISPECIES: hypothetical protein [Shewanella]QXP44794.1 hypothetical protein FM038_25420 [Shewanella eurypsychrophilus]
MNKTTMITGLLLANENLPKEKKLKQAVIAVETSSSLAMVGKVKSQMKARGEL